MHGKYRQWFQIVFVFIVLTGSLLIGLGNNIAFGQSGLTTPVPVETQVWIDLTASAIARSGPPDANASATYEAAFQNAVQTVTVAAFQNAMQTVTVDALTVSAANKATATAEAKATATATPSAIQSIPTVYTPGTATDQAQYDATATFRADLTQTAAAGEPYIPPELDDIKTDLTHVDGGKFMMGTSLDEANEAVDDCALYGKTCSPSWISDSIPAHEMPVDGFEMEVYEVTAAQYVAFLNWLGSGAHMYGCGQTRCAFTQNEQETSTLVYKNGTYSVISDFYNDHPATWVTWYGAQAYCETIGRRLPTEVEWEHAARGPQNLIYPWGDAFEVDYANSGIPEAEGTYPVATYTQGISAYGVYHMAGNVQEWVQDWYDPILYINKHADNPDGPAEGSTKVLRGGSWDTGPLFLRSVHRRSASPDSASAAIGFRCAADTTE